MPHRYIFVGQVLPQRTYVSVPRDERPIRAANGSLTGTLTIEVFVGQITAIANIDVLVSDVRSFKEGIEGLVRSRIDAFGYLCGRGYDVEITTGIRPDGSSEVYGVGIDALGAAEKERPVNFEVLNDLLKSLELRRALADLRCAIRYPVETQFFCYRAMETIAQAFREVGKVGKDPAGWERMRAALRVDRSWLDADRDEAEALRHGRAGLLEQSGGDRVAVLERAWKVVDRFCMYLHRPEDLAGQPILTLNK